MFDKKTCIYIHLIKSFFCAHHNNHQHKHKKYKSYNNILSFSCYQEYSILLLFSFTLIVHLPFEQETCVSRKQYIINIIYSLLGMKRNRYIMRKLDCCLICKEEPRICSVCSTSGNRRRTRYYCKTCTFYVCADGCYDEHRRMI